MIRTRLCLYLLLLVPLAVYWQTIFHDYGMRDDYRHLRATREAPGMLVKVTASHGHPLAGALLETTFGVTDDVAQLPWLRLASVLLMVVLGLAIWRQLYQSGWSEIEAAAIGLGVILLPAAQVGAGWAIAWPHALALLLSVAGFSAIETELERGGLKRAVALLGGCMIYALAALIYQANALFAVVLIAAVLLVRSGREPMTDPKWLAYHLGALVLGLGVAYSLVQGLIGNGVFHESARMQLEGQPFAKLGWFFRQPLPNALALYALRDDFGSGAALFWGAVAVSAALIGAGVRLTPAGTGAWWKRKWFWCLGILPFVAHAAALLSAERSTAYRMLFPLSGLVLVYALFGLRALTSAAKLKPLLHYAGLGVLATGVAWNAHRQAYGLIAEPQGHEWDIVQSALLRASFTKPTKVYFISPTLAERSTDVVCGDEFGSLSSDSPGVPKDMVKAALHERFGAKLPKGGSYTFTAGRDVPAPQAYDVVIDMRRLKQRKAP
ncbi:MAG: hypothetical protein HYX71_01225 [Opitutae bacterium]|nr:hypothetical protein [Opitutae bacterium]